VIVLHELTSLRLCAFSFRTNFPSLVVEAVKACSTLGGGSLRNENLVV
jgi:hypothetical protein